METSFIEKKNVKNSVNIALFDVLGIKIFMFLSPWSVYLEIYFITLY